MTLEKSDMYKLLVSTIGNLGTTDSWKDFLSREVGMGWGR